MKKTIKLFGLIIFMVIIGFTFISCGPKCPNNKYCEGQWEWYGTGEDKTGLFRGTNCQNSSCNVYLHSIDNTKAGSVKCNCN